MQVAIAGILFGDGVISINQCATGGRADDHVIDLSVKISCLSGEAAMPRLHAGLVGDEVLRVETGDGNLDLGAASGGETGHVRKVGCTETLGDACKSVPAFLVIQVHQCAEIAHCGMPVATDTYSSTGFRVFHFVGIQGSVGVTSADCNFTPLSGLHGVLGKDA